MKKHTERLGLCLFLCNCYGIFALRQNVGNSTLRENIEICPLVNQVEVVTDTEENVCLPSHMSCRDACGRSRAACSCQSICVVYNNCCEDFPAQCSDMSQEAARLYKSKDIESECDKSDKFVVTACNLELNRSLMKRFSDVNFITDTVKHSKKYKQIARDCWANAIMTYNVINKLRDVEGQTDFVASLSQFLYVTDLKTKIVYKSLDVFNCHASVTSVPCVWQVTVTAFNDMSTGFQRIKPLFSNPVEKINKKLSKCKYSARKECDPTSDFFSPIRKEKCLSFTSPVKTINGSTTIFYKNRHCMACETGTLNINEETASIEPRDYHKHVSGSFSAVLSLSNDDIELHIDRTDYFIGWIKSKCSLTGNCRDTQCVDHLFVLRPDGFCKVKYTLYIAMTVTTDRHIIERLPELLRCVLHRYEHWDLDGHQRPEFKTFKFQNDSYMYGMSVDFYSKERSNHRAQLEKLAVETGNYLVEIINNNESLFTDYNQEHQFNKYSFDSEVLENETWHIIRKWPYSTENPYPGPFCGFVRIKGGAQYQFLCFPRKPNLKARSMRLAHVHNMTCVREFLSDTGTQNNLEILGRLLLVMVGIIVFC